MHVHNNLQTFVPALVYKYAVACDYVFVFVLIHPLAVTFNE